MEATLRGVSGPGMDVLAVIKEGQPVSVGRIPLARISISGDTFLSGVHFKVECQKDKVILRDLGSSNGTSVNGVRVQEKLLADGDSISAGSSAFQIEIKGAKVDLVEMLSTQTEPLFAVLDAARNRKIYDLILLSGAPYCSLYQGKSAAELEHVAPYLVALAPRCELLKQLVAEGWGKSWGIFLTCNQPMDAVRHQLRRSLMVTLEGKQEYVYFRFYDPRVLRTFLPIADKEQLEELAGPISSFLIEDEEPDGMLRFGMKSGVIYSEKITTRRQVESSPG